MPPQIPVRVQLDHYFYNVTGDKQGGFGRVWLLERPAGAETSTIYGSHRAAKTFEGQDQEAVVTELSNWILLHHSAILPLIKISRLNFRIAALMELRKGTLADVLSQRQLTWRETRQVLLQVCSALQYAYENHQLAHLDIKPDNVLVDEFPNKVQVSDWGISRLVMKGKITGSGAFTPGYVAPERLLGSSIKGPSADIFSVGMIAIKALCGALPYVLYEDEDKHGSRWDQQFRQLHSGAYYKTAKYQLKSLPNAVQRMILSCVHPEPSARWRDYGSLANELTRAL